MLSFTGLRSALSVRVLVIIAMGLALALMVTMLTVISAPVPAQAATSTGTGGQFVPKQQRIFDSRSTEFGNAIRKVSKDRWTAIPVAGKNGMPTQIGAVQVTFTALNPSEAGVLYADKTGVATPNTTMPYLSFYYDNTSNTAVLPVGSDGAIQVSSNIASLNLLVDVQGYYTEGDPVAGGYVPLDKGTRIYASGSRKFAQGETLNVKIGGANGVPANASAAIVSIVTSQPGTSTGHIQVYPTGTPPTSDWSFNWNETQATEWTSAVKIGTNGNITVDFENGGPVIVSVGIQGYFTAGGTAGGAGFTPTHTRVYDSRDGSTTIPAGANRAIQVSGLKGIPAFGSGINALAVNAIIISSNRSGHMKMWADDTTEPTEEVQQFYEDRITYGFTAVRVGSGGGVIVKNSSGAPINVVIDVEGWWSGLQAGPSTTGLTGGRPSQTTLPVGVSDHVQGVVDVATGNLQLNTAGLSIPGVNGQMTTGATYNSRGWQQGSDTSPAAARWAFGFASAGQLSANDTGITYTGVDGATWPFAAVKGSSSYKAPAGLARDLTRTTSGYEMMDRASRQKIVFDYNGRPSTVTDRNGNVTRLNYTGWDLTSAVSTAGPTTARTATVGYNDTSRTLTVTQRGGNDSRTLSYVKDAANNLVSFTNATGAVTRFAYTGELLTKITGPAGQITTIAYDSTGRVNRVDQANTTAGSPGTATTRLSYPTTTETQVADPNTDTNASVSAVPHTTYTRNATTNLVTKTVDAAGRIQSATYNAANNAVASSTTGSGSGAATTTGKFDANDSQSLTNVTSATGSSSSATYGSTAATAYQPATSTDSSSNTTTYGFNGVGNQMSTTTGSGGTSATATLQRNANGPISTATAPANEGNPTKYFYDTNTQLSIITPPTGTSLGDKTFTYDGYGRMASQTDGRGGTTTFTYDKTDRLLTTAFSDGTPTVTNTYDATGNLTSQASATGTITNTFDQQNRMVSTANSAGGGTITFGYDKASHETRTTSSVGTTTHTYDASGVLTSTSYPKNGSTATQQYASDDKGRRTNTWLASNGDHTQWAAKTTTGYDSSGRVTQIRAWTGTGDTSNTPVFDTTYCYQASTTAPTCTASLGSDRDTLQWSRDNLTGQATTYGYADGRLITATQSGGPTNTSWTYSYDANGNRTGELIDGPTPSNQALTFNAASQITTPGYTYDGSGNLIASPGATYTYNGAQQMTSSTKDGITTNYTYAGTDQNQVLTENVQGGTAYSYVYGAATSQGVPELVEQTTSGSGTSTVLTDPVTGQPLNLTTSNGLTGLYLSDGTGNQVGLLTDTSTTAFKVAYSPYGTQNVTQGATTDAWRQNPFGFKTGTRTDNGTIVKFGMRWYLAATGTWTQRDTLDAPLDPKNANRYGYAGGDPTNASDPTGAWSTNVGGTACYGFCGGLSVDVDTDGGVGITGSLGVGTPGGQVGFGASQGNVGTGFNAGAQCSAGPVSVGYGTEGLYGSAGTSLSSPLCAGTVSYTLQLG